jgi:hypothetical protein
MYGLYVDVADEYMNVGVGEGAITYANSEGIGNEFCRRIRAALKTKESTSGDHMAGKRKCWCCRRHLAGQRER